jgi:hypothetical protein
MRAGIPLSDSDVPSGYWVPWSTGKIQWRDWGGGVPPRALNKFCREPIEEGQDDAWQAQPQ